MSKNQFDKLVGVSVGVSLYLQIKNKSARSCLYLDPVMCRFL